LTNGRRLAVLASALALALAGAGQATAGGTCVSSYSYAGLANAGSGHGVKATITALALPQVEWGHVAAWVGVGGPGMGPNGEDAWIQIGFSGFFGSTNRLYYEITRPGDVPRYTEVEAEVPLGAARRLAVLEMAGKRDWWRVWVDGIPVSEPVHLPGSHGRWTPMATAESWNAGREACNRFDYRFERVMVASVAGGRWKALDPGFMFEDPGYRVVMRAPAGFLARAI
jgi:hypothetical protein